MFNKVVSNIFLSIILVVLVYFLVVNVKNGTTSQFATTYDGTLFLVSTLVLIVSTFVLGVLAGVLSSIGFGARYKEQVEFYARKTEKLAQQNEIDSDDKEALQRKIATLEIALENALKNKG